MHALALALNYAAILGHAERNPAAVDRLASELIELATRHNFVHWLALGAIHRGWARTSLCEAIRIAREQKSIPNEKRTEATYAEYRRQKTSGSGVRGFRLPL
jgi:hypothetical protein